MAHRNGVDIDISHVAAVENETTQQQEQEAYDILMRKEEAERRAEQARAEAARRKAEQEAEKKRREEEKRRREKEKEEAEEAARKKKEETLTAAATAGTALLGAAVSGAKKKKKGMGGFIPGLVIGVIAGALGMFVIGRLFSVDPVQTAANVVHETMDVVLDETFTGYTALDFQDAVLGEARGQQKLVVMEQPVELSTTVTKAGLGNLAVFQKMKTITCFGTGKYTVDLKQIDADHIDVDEEAKLVTITIPHAVLDAVVPAFDLFEFDDTEKGILAFGDLSLTMEQQNEVQKAVTATMTEYLSQESVMAQADEFARMKTWDTFQPIVTSVSPEFKVEMVIE